MSDHPHDQLARLVSGYWHTQAIYYREQVMFHIMSRRKGQKAGIFLRQV
jgi:hypothetical protein